MGCPLSETFTVPQSRCMYSAINFNSAFMSSYYSVHVKYMYVYLCALHVHCIQVVEDELIKSHMETIVEVYTLNAIYYMYTC